MAWARRQPALEARLRKGDDAGARVRLVQLDRLAPVGDAAEGVDDAGLAPLVVDDADVRAGRDRRQRPQPAAEDQTAHAADRQAEQAAPRQRRAASVRRRRSTGSGSPAARASRSAAQRRSRASGGAVGAGRAAAPRSLNFA